MAESTSQVETPDQTSHFVEDPDSDDCLQCGEEQQIGTLIMAALGMIGTFGAFFMSLLYLTLGLNPAPVGLAEENFDGASVFQEKKVE